MNPSFQIALKWGFIIGLANLIWLYLAFYLGLHTSGIAIFQVFMLIWLIISLIGYILAIRAIHRLDPHGTYWQGLQLGAVVAAGLSHHGSHCSDRILEGNSP